MNKKKTPFQKLADKRRPALICEFRRICGSSRDSDVYLVKQILPVAPCVGELINIDGRPYIIRERSWALGTDASDGPLYCYLRLVPDRCKG